jgi:hypothetical protein
MSIGSNKIGAEFWSSMNPGSVYTSLVIGYRRPGEQYAQCNVTKESFGGGSIMVWIGIFLDVATELVVLDRRNLNAHGYITNILEPVIVPFVPFAGQDFIYMQNNDSHI